MPAKLFCRSLLLIGPLIVGSLYLTWLVGRLSLGHWPRPSLDDPKDIAWAAPLYFATLALSLLWPAAFLSATAAAVHAWFTRDPQRIARLVETVAGTALLAAGIWFIRHDPRQVGLWFGD